MSSTFHNEQERERRFQALRLEIDCGIHQLDHGYCTEIETENELRAFFDDIARRGEARINGIDTDRGW